MPRLVGSLARDRHPQSPLRIRKIDEVARRHLGGVDFLVHLPGQEFQAGIRMIVRKVGEFVPAILAIEPLVTDRVVGPNSFGSSGFLGSSGSRRFLPWNERTESGLAQDFVDLVFGEFGRLAKLDIDRRNSVFWRGQLRAHRVDFAAFLDLEFGVGVGQEADRRRHLHQGPRVALRQLLDPAIGKTHVLDLIDVDAVEHIGRAVIAELAKIQRKAPPITSMAPASSVRFWIVIRPTRLSTAQVISHSSVLTGNSPLKPPISLTRR